MELITFIADLGIFSLLWIVVFWGVATYAFAGWARFEKDWVWGLGGSMFPVIGFVLAVILYFSARGGGAQSLARESSSSDELW